MSLVGFMRPGVPLALAVMLGVASSAPLAGQASQGAHDAHRLHGDPAASIATLEDPKRDAYQKPQEVLAALAPKPGEIIADIGAGSGYFALRLAQQVGAAGHVYGVDISPDMIRHLNQRIHEAGLVNISTILAQPDNPLLPRPVDRVLFVNVWHHVEGQAGYLELLKKTLKPGGQIVMIDFHKRDLPVGPPAAMKIAREDLIRQMTSQGFEVRTEHTFLPYQYFLVFERN
jgi:ubiquinone/menaquinone biosynthesis C-methylase UbiE